MNLYLYVLISIIHKKVCIYSQSQADCIISDENQKEIATEAELFRLQAIYITFGKYPIVITITEQNIRATFDPAPHPRCLACAKDFLGSALSIRYAIYLISVY